MDQAFTRMEAVLHEEVAGVEGAAARASSWKSWSGHSRYLGLLGFCGGGPGVRCIGATPGLLTNLVDTVVVIESGGGLDTMWASWSPGRQ